MPMTKVQIISFALAKLGNKPISSLDNQSDLVVTAEQAFDILFDLSISLDTWRFACKIAQLSTLEIEPIVNRWQYIYQLPGDYLKMSRQDPHNYNYEVYQKKHLYSNVTPPLYIDYMYQPSISELPPYFAHYLACKIAEHLALASAHNVQFSQKLGIDANMARVEAQAADAQNRPQTPMMSAPIISNRYISGTRFYSGILNDPPIITRI